MTHLQLSLRLLTLLAALIFCATLPPIGALAQQRSNAADMSASLFSPAPYTVGERLTYNVSFATFPSAAYIELAVANRTTINNRDAIELQAHVETLGIVNAALYAANRDYRTFVDPRTGVPFRTQVTTRDGARTDDASRDYNQPAGTAAIPASATRGSISGTYDFISALYRARALPLAVGSVYRFQIVGDRSTTEAYDVELRVTGRELAQTSVGSYNTLAATARVRGGGSNNYPTRINFTDDERHVPVLVRVQHPSGEIRAELVSSTLTAPASPAQSPLAALPPANDAMPTPFPPTAMPATPSRPPAGTATLATPNVGEQLNYNVYLGTSPQIVGAIFFEVRARGMFFNREGILVNAIARTSGVGDRLFPVNDRLTSYLDPATLLPFRTEVQIQEGTRRLNRILTYDQERGIVTRQDGLTGEIPTGTYDLASLIYALRRFDLTPPRRTSIAILTANRPSALTITAVRREQIQIGGEQVPAVQLALTTNDREPDRNAYRLWISDDARRLPLRFTMTTPLGTVRADLAIIPVVRQ